MIFLSLDINKESVKEFLDSLEEIKNSKFDGVDICLWEDMNSKASEIKEALERNGLKSNVHADMMLSKEGFQTCKQKFLSGIKFKERIGSQFFVTHPIKPYTHNLILSKKLFDESNEEFLVETVDGIGLNETNFLKRPVAVDIGHVVVDNNYNVLKEYKNILWIHVHDFKNEIDHLPLGKGDLNLNKLIRMFPNHGFTIELGREFRRWKELKDDYKDSIDKLNNSIVYNKGYGKNVRLKHLLNLIGDKSFERAVDLGCSEGYLIYNIKAKEKIGYDINPIPLFNSVVYMNKDVATEMSEHADIVICSEVIEHVKEDINVIKNIYAILKQGGLIFLSTINKNISEDKSKLDLERGHYRRYGPDLKKIMESMGFETLSFYPFRSSHYYENKGNFSRYNMNLDIEEGAASGWIYFGKKGYKK